MFTMRVELNNTDFRSLTSPNRCVGEGQSGRKKRYEVFFSTLPEFDGLIPFLHSYFFLFFIPMDPKTPQERNCGYDRNLAPVCIYKPGCSGIISGMFFCLFFSLRIVLYSLYMLFISSMVALFSRGRESTQIAECIVSLLSHVLSEHQQHILSLPTHNIRHSC